MGSVGAGDRKVDVAYQEQGYRLTGGLSTIDQHERRAARRCDRTLFDDVIF